MGFKNYIINERKTEEKALLIALKGVPGVDDIIEKSRTSKSVVFHLKSSDRTQLKKIFRKFINKNGYNFSEGRGSSTILPEVATIGGLTYKIYFKPSSGGMQETTLNSTITELVPCIAFMDNLSYKDYADLYKKVFASKQTSVYVGKSDLE